MNGYPSFYPRIALVAPSPGWYASYMYVLTIVNYNGDFALPETVGVIMYGVSLGSLILEVKEAPVQVLFWKWEKKKKNNCTGNVLFNRA